jgi:hypothetical protein
MTIYKEYRVGGSNSPFGFLGPLLILAVFFTALFFLAKGLFWIFSWIAPVLLIITLIIDHQVVVDFFKFVWKLLKENTIMGILAVLLVFFGYPIVAGYLFFKALGKRSIKKVIENVEKEKNTYTEYEEVVEDDSFLELPPLKKQAEAPKQSKSNEYDDMFK